MLPPLLADIDLDSMVQLQKCAFEAFIFCKVGIGPFSQIWQINSRLKHTLCIFLSVVHAYASHYSVHTIGTNLSDPPDVPSVVTNFTFNTCKVYDSHPHWLDKYGKLPSVFTLLAVLSPSTPIHNQNHFYQPFYQYISLT